MKLLLLADLHFGTQFEAWTDQAEAARRELVRAWTETVDLVTSPVEAIDGVWVGGDLFHSPEPDVSVLETVFQGLDRMAQAGKKIVVIPGIYDGIVSPRSVYRHRVWPSGVTVVDWCRPRVLDLDLRGEALHLLTFAPLPRALDLPASISFPETGVRAGLFHAVTRTESPLAAWGPRLAIQELGGLGLKLAVIGGDVHFREALWSNTVVVSPGCLVPLRPRDAETSAWTLAEISSSGVTIERRPRQLELVFAPPASPMSEGEKGRAGGLRGAFLRVYESRKLESSDRELLEAAVRYGLQELDRLEIPRVD